MFAESKGGSGNDFDLSKLQKLLKVKQKLKKLLTIEKDYGKITLFLADKHNGD